jgi:tetratricopeptide (TPR) repeat protein
MMSVYRIGTVVIVLALFVIVLPVGLDHSSSEVSEETCVRFADHPPADRPDLLGELERCRAVVPLDVELLADLGAAYERAGRQQDAERTYRDAVAIDNTYADLHVRLATVLLRRGATSEARQHAEHALRIQPNRDEVEQLLEDINRSHTP